MYNVQMIRYDSTGSASFTGALGQLTINTTKNVVIVHDGVTAGGYEMARYDLSNVPNATSLVYGRMTPAQVTQLATNTVDIATNASNIATNTSNITTNTSNIGTNTADIATNASGIANNTSNITTNTNNIATNTNNIATNTADIATNVTNIATNASRIATNIIYISTNTGNIATNAGNIATNTSNIATNTSNIATINSTAAFLAGTASFTTSQIFAAGFSQTGGSAKFRNGNVLISPFGTDITPAADLHVHQGVASTGTYIKLTNVATGTTTSDGSFVGIDPTGILQIANKENSALNFYTNNTFRGKIAANGTVLFGDSDITPSANLQVYSAGTASTNFRVNNDIGGGALNVDGAGNFRILQINATSHIYMFTNAGQVSRFTAAGAFTTGSETGVVDTFGSINADAYYAQGKRGNRVVYLDTPEALVSGGGPTVWTSLTSTTLSSNNAIAAILLITVNGSVYSTTATGFAVIRAYVRKGGTSITPPTCVLAECDYPSPSAPQMNIADSNTIMVNLDTGYNFEYLATEILVSMGIDISLIGYVQNM